MPKNQYIQGTIIKENVILGGKENKCLKLDENVQLFLFKNFFTEFKSEKLYLSYF